MSLGDETRTKGGVESVDRIAHRHFAGETRVRKARDVCVKTLGRQGVGNEMLEEDVSRSLRRRLCRRLAKVYSKSVCEFETEEERFPSTAPSKE